jgi:hypothetical protein
LNDYKLVTDVKFIEAAEVEENSIEWFAEALGNLGEKRNANSMAIIL